MKFNFTFQKIKFFENFPTHCVEILTSGWRARCEIELHYRWKNTEVFSIYLHSFAPTALRRLVFKHLKSAFYGTKKFSKTENL